MSDNWPSRNDKEACSREELNVRSSEMKSAGDWGGRRGALQQPLKRYFNVCSISPHKIVEIQVLTGLSGQDTCIHCHLQQHCMINELISIVSPKSFHCLNSEYYRLQSYLGLSTNSKLKLYDLHKNPVIVQFSLTCRNVIT